MFRHHAGMSKQRTSLNSINPDVSTCRNIGTHLSNYQYTFVETSVRRNNGTSKHRYYPGVMIPWANKSLDMCYILLICQDMKMKLQVKAKVKVCAKIKAIVKAKAKAKAQVKLKDQARV